MKLQEILLARIGQDFDGECHLTEAEVRETIAQLDLYEAALLDIRNRVLCPVGPAPTLDQLQEIASAALNSTDTGA